MLQTNLVTTLLDSLPDEILTVDIGPAGRRQIMVKRTTEGYAQASNGGCSISLDVA